MEKCNHCDQPAQVSYVWPWGEKGLACVTHLQGLQQTAANLGRELTIAPLAASAAPAPMTRDERILLHAKVLTLEAEVEEVKQRGLALLQDNEQLSRTATTAELRQREYKAQLDDANDKLAQAQHELQERTADLAVATDELQRLRTIQSFQPSVPAPRQPGALGLAQAASGLQAPEQQPEQQQQPSPGG